MTELIIIGLTAVGLFIPKREEKVDVVKDRAIRDFSLTTSMNYM